MSPTCLAGAVSRKEVLLEDIKELLTCCCCHEAPMLPPIQMCRHGHCFCTKCRIVQKSCKVCSEPLSSRNLPLEKILVPLLQPVHPDEESSDKEMDQRQEEMNPTLTGAYQAVAEYMKSIVDRDCKDHVLTCGRTFSCPFPCSAIITRAGLYRHFGFQHPEVFISHMYKNLPFSIFIPRELFDQVNKESPTRCVYFLVVAIGDEEYTKENNVVDIKNIKGPDLLSVNHNMTNMLQQRTYLALISIHRLADPDVYLLWATGLYDFAPVTYTLSYNNEFEYVSFQGKPASFLEPSPVDQKGGCLILSSGMVKRNFEHHSSYLELTLFFHLELPYPQVFPGEPDASAAKLIHL